MKNSIVLNFGGKELSFYFGLTFLGVFHDKFGCLPHEIYDELQQNPFKIIPKLMFESYLHDCERREIEPEINKIKFIDLIEEDGGLGKNDGVVNKFLEAFYSSLVKDVPIEDAKESTAEKKN